jgi:hypothetical protein
MKSAFFLLMLLTSLPALSVEKIYFQGEIEADSLARLEKRIVKEAGRFKENSDRIIEITLDSGGGNLIRTFESVKRIRNLETSLNVKIHTRVNSTCESSCTVLYTAGSVRLAGKRASFGFHSPAIASSVPHGVSRTEIIENARDRWIAAINEVDSQLAADLERDGLLLRSRMTYLKARNLLHGYVTEIK